MTPSDFGVPAPLKVINLWAGPGAGKSTLAADLFALMKRKGHVVELVHEVAKDLTYDGDMRRLNSQVVSLGQQYDRLDRLQGQVEWAITDSPLPLGLAYAGPRWDTPAFFGIVREMTGHFVNHHYWVARVQPYQEYGRTQSEAQALEMDKTILAIFRRFSPDARAVKGQEGAAKAIYKHVFGVSA